MPARKRHRAGYPADIFMALEGGRRVGWAKYYDEARHSRELQHANDVLVDRIETLLPELIAIKDAILVYGAHPEPFCRAYRLEELIIEFERGLRK